MATTIVLLAASFSLPNTRADMAVPVWKVGNEWTYDVTQQSSGNTGNGTSHLQVVGYENVTVSSSTYATYRCALHSNVTSPLGRLRLQATAFFRVSDLTLVKEANFTVEPSVNRTVPAGTFLTIPLYITTGGNYTRDYWSLVVGNYVEEDYLDTNNHNRARLTAYNYTMPRKNPLGGPSPQGSEFPWLVWLGVGAGIAVAAILVLVLSRKKPRAPTAAPPAQPEPPTSPPSQP